MPATDAGTVVVRAGQRCPMIADLAIGETTIGGEIIIGETETGATITGAMIVPRGRDITATETTSSVAFRDGETETLTGTALLETGVTALPEMEAGGGIRGLARSTLCQRWGSKIGVLDTP